MLNQKTHVKFLVQSGIIAAIYVILVMIFAFSSFGPVQFRVAEALTILPYFTPAAIPGLIIGCFFANILGGAHLLDIIFGTVATGIAAWASYGLRNHKWLVPWPPILINAVVIGVILKYVYVESAPVIALMGSVFAGQVVSILIIGMILLHALKRVDKIFD